jgi:AcrR family transcriptional regulator
MNRSEEIRNADIELFTEKDMKNTSVGEMVSRVSIARTTIYEYYSSKEEILYDLLDTTVSQEISYISITILHTFMETS